LFPCGRKRIFCPKPVQNVTINPVLGPTSGTSVKERVKAYVSFPCVAIYILARLLLAPLMLWTITTLVFLLLRHPGDPVDAVLGNRAPIVSKRRIANG